MIFTQQLAAVHAFDHNNACNRGSAAFLSTSPKKPASRYYFDSLPVEANHPFADARPTNKPSLHDSFESSDALVMPCPKKAAVLCSNAFLGANPVVAAAPLRWDPSSALDDSQDLETPLVLVGNDDEDLFFDQAACAELMEIMSSSGSSRSSSGSSSPQSSLNDDAEPSSPADFSVPLGLFEEYAAYFGSSPIVRANNPLPNDESFRPAHPEVATEVTCHLQSFLSRRHQAKVFDFNLNVDEDGEMQIPSRANFNRVGVMF
jgi:hypothetical protein